MKTILVLMAAFLFAQAGAWASYKEVKEVYPTCDWGAPYLNQNTTKLSSKGFRSEIILENIYEIMTFGLAKNTSEREYFTVQYKYKNPSGQEIVLSNCALIHNKLYKTIYIYDCEDSSGAHKFSEFNCKYLPKAHAKDTSNPQPNHSNKELNKNIFAALLNNQYLLQ